MCSTSGAVRAATGTRLLLTVLLAASLAPSPTDAQQGGLPKGVVEIKPRQGETATARAGGPDGVFTWKGALRCRGDDEAIVGARVRRGRVLDYLQIVCAAVSCDGGDCRWDRYLSTASVGDPNGGNAPVLMLCRQNEVVAGFRARVLGLFNLQYVEDISIQCAPIAGPPVKSVAPVAAKGRSWRTTTGHLDRPQVEGICPAGGASAVAAFAGRYATGANVAQALALLCGSSRSACPDGTHTDFSPLGPELYNPMKKRPANAPCPECCKPCVTLQGSMGVSGRTDREVANLPIGRYNCHFYTLSYMNYVAPPIQAGRPPRRFQKLPGNIPFVGSTEECLEDTDFDAYGFRKVQAGTVDPNALEAGDVVAVFSAAVVTQSCRNSHSGVVIGVDPLVIRQKPNPEACVTDFTWDEFTTFYQARGRSHRVNAWRLEQ